MGTGEGGEVMAEINWTVIEHIDCEHLEWMDKFEAELDRAIEEHEA